MKIISWNVNGINSTIKKGFFDFFTKEKADIYCLQEIKVSDQTLDKTFQTPPGYFRYWNQAERKGYSGVMVLTKLKPLSVQYGLGFDEFDSEGRLLTLEFEDFYLINAYIPNAGRGLPRLDFKLNYNQKLYTFMEMLKKEKNVILCGDLNVAHKEIDLTNPKSNKKNAGFTIEERDSFSNLLDLGYVDSFREFESDGGNYTWWSYRNNARARNIGWRLDYFVVNQTFMSGVKKSSILPNVVGSDHCPIKLLLK
jgi:exodeoxyribonuclease III